MSAPLSPPLFIVMRPRFMWSPFVLTPSRPAYTTGGGR